MAADVSMGTEAGDDAGRDVPSGASTAANTVGLSGLAPFTVLTLPPVTLRPQPGVVRVWIDLPPGAAFDPVRPLSYRVYGGEAGLDFESHGRIVTLGDVAMPLVLPYLPRVFPAPPARGQLVLDVSCRFVLAGKPGFQDMQWRQPVVWDKPGATVLELHCRLEA